MIDWSKPLVVKNFNNINVTLVGTTLGGNVIIKNSSGTLIEVEADTGRILDHRNFFVTNYKEPWREAFEQYCIEEEDDGTEEYIFKRGFELGRNWK
jgi:hypothetical protein